MAHLRRVVSRWEKSKYNKISKLIDQDVYDLADNDPEVLYDAVGRLYGLGEELSHGFWRSLYHDTFPADWKVYQSITVTSAIRAFLDMLLGYNEYFRPRYRNFWGMLLLNRLAIEVNRASNLFSDLLAGVALSVAEVQYLTQLAPLSVFLLAETQPEIRKTVVNADYLDFDMLSWNAAEVKDLLKAYDFWSKYQKMHRYPDIVRLRRSVPGMNILKGLLGSGKLTEKQELALLPAMFRYGFATEIATLLPNKVKNANPLLSAAIGSGRVDMVDLALSKFSREADVAETVPDAPEDPTLSFLVHIYSVLHRNVLRKMLALMAVVYDMQQRAEVQQMSYDARKIADSPWGTLDKDKLHAIETYTGMLTRATEYDRELEYETNREARMINRQLHRATKRVDWDRNKACPHCGAQTAYVRGGDTLVCRKCAQTVGEGSYSSPEDSGEDYYSE